MLYRVGSCRRRGWCSIEVGPTTSRPTTIAWRRRSDDASSAEVLIVSSTFGRLFVPVPPLLACTYSIYYEYSYLLYASIYGAYVRVFIYTTGTTSLPAYKYRRTDVQYGYTRRPPASYNVALHIISSGSSCCTGRVYIATTALMYKAGGLGRRNTQYRRSHVCYFRPACDQWHNRRLFKP